MQANDVYKDMTDEQLAIVAKEDAEALEYLLDKYKGLVKMKAHSYYLTGADGEDIVQEGMIGLYRAVISFQDGHQSSFRSFAEMCVTRRMITAIKAATRQKHQPLNNYVSINKPIGEEGAERTLEEIVADEGEGLDPEQLFIDKETAQTTEEMIMSRLSPFERKVADLYIKGMGYQEIAEVLEKSPKSVDNALQRIKSKAEKILKEQN